MRLLIDSTAASFSFVTRSDEHGDTRSYYVAQKVTGRLMIVVCRNGVRLNASSFNQVVDVKVGWDKGTLGFVHEENIGKRHTKLTIYRVSDLQEEELGKWLGSVLRRAPEVDDVVI